MAEAKRAYRRREVGPEPPIGPVQGCQQLLRLADCSGEHPRQLLRFALREDALVADDLVAAVTRCDLRRLQRPNPPQRLHLGDLSLVRTGPNAWKVQAVF